MALTYVVVLCLFCAVLGHPVEDFDVVQNGHHTSWKAPRLWKRFVSPTLAGGGFEEGALGGRRLRTRRSTAEECEKLQLCKLHARSSRNFIAAFELYFVNAKAMFADAGVPDYFAVLRLRAASFWDRVRSSSNELIAAVGDDIYGNGFIKHWLFMHQSGNKNKENARLWDHRAHSIADCERTYTGCHGGPPPRAPARAPHREVEFVDTDYESY